MGAIEQGRQLSQLFRVGSGNELASRLRRFGHEFHQPVGDDGVARETRRGGALPQFVQQSADAGFGKRRAGDGDRVRLVGGVDALNDILMFMCFSKTPALSPTGDCRVSRAATAPRFAVFSTRVGERTNDSDGAPSIVERTGIRSRRTGSCPTPPTASRWQR